MNKRALSPVLIAISISMSLLSATAFTPVFAQAASLAVQAGPNAGNTLAAGNPGDTFTVQVLIDNVAALVGYDVTLQYNTNTLMATSVDFGNSANTVFCLDAQGVPHAGGCRLTSHLVEKNDLSTGIIRSAATLQGGITMDVNDGLTGALPVFIVTFQVLSRGNSPLHIFPDSDCGCQSIAAIVNSQSVAVDHDTVDGAFFAEPNILLVAAYANFSFAGAFPQVSHIHKGQTFTTIQSTVSLGSTETLAGFVFVVYDVIDPHGNVVEVVSNERVLLPGDVKTVSAQFPFSSDCSVSCGTYVIFATIWRGGVDSDVAPFTQSFGFHFRVNP